MEKSAGEASDVKEREPDNGTADDNAGSDRALQRKSSELQQSQHASSANAFSQTESKEEVSVQNKSENENVEDGRDVEVVDKEQPTLMTTSESITTSSRGDNNPDAEQDTSPNESESAIVNSSSGKENLTKTTIDSNEINHQMRGREESDPTAQLIEGLRSQISDLGAQVTSLNTKLITSFGKIGDLEDELFANKEENSKAKKRVEELERLTRAWDDSVEGGVYVEKAHVQNELSRMMDRVLSETTLRQTAESDKQLFERELDDLSASLFAEANNMVSSEKKARFIADEKSKSLAERLKDTEELMTAQGAQLRDLGTKLEQVEKQRDELRESSEFPADLSHMSSETAAERHEHRLASDSHDIPGKSTSGALEDTNSDPNKAARGNESETSTIHNVYRPPKSSKRTGRWASSESSQQFSDLHFTYKTLHHLPHLMSNITPFKEFVSFIRHLRQLREQTLATVPYPYQHTHQSLGIIPGSVPTFSGTTATESPSSHQDQQDNLRQFPQQPSEEQWSHLRSLVPLSTHTSHRFLSRCIEEDSNPTLRLDYAPGLNWFSRKDVGRAVIDGSLIIEPATSSHVVSKCSLCGAILSGHLPSSSGEFGQVTGETPLQVQGATASTSSNEASLTDERQPQSAKKGMRKWVANLGGSFGSSVSNRTQSPYQTQNEFQPVATASHYRSESNSLAPDSASSASPTRPGYRASHSSPHYIFRSSEGSTAVHAVCQPYCLARLRAVCEFWIFVRTIQRSILLNERFGATSALPGQLTTKKSQTSGLGKGFGGLWKFAASPVATPTGKEFCGTDKEGNRDKTQSLNVLSLEERSRRAAANATVASPSEINSQYGSAENQDKAGLKDNHQQQPTTDEVTEVTSAEASSGNAVVDDDKAVSNSGIMNQEEVKASADSYEKENASTNIPDAVQVDTVATQAQTATEKPPLPKRSLARRTPKSSIEEENAENQIKRDIPQSSADEKPTNLERSDDQDNQENVEDVETTTGSKAGTEEQQLEENKRLLPPPPFSEQKQDRPDGVASAIPNETTSTDETTAWEVKYWDELTKLKLVMFWTRIGADLPAHDISAVNALAKVPPLATTDSGNNSTEQVFSSFLFTLAAITARSRPR